MRTVLDGAPTYAAARESALASSAAAAVRFEVEDTGPGLPPGTEERVFEPFVQLEANRRGREGVGLGLATARRLVEAHGGEIGVTSRPALGCCFWFTLPAA